MDRDRLVRTMQAAARAGANVALRHYGYDTPVGMVEKGPRDYQLAADVETERAISGHLRADYPQAGISGEEGAADAQARSSLRFIIDPIDGTTNFAFRIPFFAHVITAYEDEVPVAGVVFDSIRDEMMWAVVGAGAFLNGRRLPQVAAVTPDTAIVSTGLPVPGQVTSVPVETYHRALRGVIDTAAGTRRLGSAALSTAYVALGRHHAAFEDGLDPLDYLASALILRECGGRVTDFAGRDQTGRGAVLAAVPTLHPWLVSLFR